MYAGLTIFLVGFLSMSMQAAQTEPKNIKKNTHHWSKSEKQATAKALNKLVKKGKIHSSMRKNDIEQLFEEQLSPRSPKQH